MIARAALVLAIVMSAGCAIDARSEALRCDNGVCPTGRVCESGWCVTTGQPDAPPVIADAFTCPPGCSECVGDTCVIRCDQSGACTSKVTCPAGMPCVSACASRTAEAEIGS